MDQFSGAFVVPVFECLEEQFDQGAAFLDFFRSVVRWLVGELP
jgi:hypothetical protein